MQDETEFKPAWEGPDETPTLTLSLHSVHEAVQLGTVLARSWFRGHPRAHGRLTPRIFRAELTDSLVEALRPNLELDAIQSFKTDAPAVAIFPVPVQSEQLGWLFLMQHYGCPTRLLDWTENPLAALHFAVDDLESDGELWGLYPQALNKVTEVGDGMPYPNNPVLNYLVEEPFQIREGHGNLAALHGLQGPHLQPIAFVPTRLFPRMLAQQSVFTIHPKPTPGHTIPEIVTAPEGLVRYIVPRQHKRQIRADLAAIGVTHRTLFPDFEGLSRHIVHEMAVVGYGAPKPPDFGRSASNG